MGQHEKEYVVVISYTLESGRDFSNFSCMFLNPNIFFQFKFIRYEKHPGVLTFHCLKGITRTILTVGQNNIGNKIPFLHSEENFNSLHSSVNKGM